MKIERNHYETAYELSKRVRNGDLQLTEARDILVENGVNSSSAIALLNNMRHLRNGTTYKWTMSQANSDDYLTWIRRDYGDTGLALALTSFRQHIEYYSKVSGGSLQSLRKVLAKHDALLPADHNFFDSPEEVPSSITHLEGKVRQVMVNTYERNPAARAKCLAYYGYTCTACEFDFEKTYGELGEGFIHVHHLKEISTIGEEYEVDPIEDLRPVCPNCHAMLHRKSPALSIEALKEILKNHN